MYPMYVPPVPSAEEVAEVIIAKQRINEISIDMRDSGYNLAKITDYLKGENRDYAIGALLQATEKGRVSVNEGVGREVWGNFVKSLEDCSVTKRSYYEIKAVGGLYKICNPPMWRGLALVGAGLLVALTPLFAPFIRYMEICHGIQLGHLRKKFGLEESICAA